MKLFRVLPVALVVGSLTSASVIAQDDEYLKPVVKSASEINESAEASQQKINKITDKIIDKVQQFKNLNRQIEDLQVYNALQRKQVANQEQQLADLNESIDQVSVIERKITPLMIKMIAGLEQFVELDVPFLQEERAERISTLKSMMDRADVAPSEKFRRVMEAYQVEMDYGKTLESYTGLQMINGQEREVEYLRVGRTALIYQTSDASLTGIWNNQTRQWEALSSDYRTQVTKGLRMAKKQLGPNLITLPVAITD